MSQFVSVIIPLYNGENYICTCLDSIRQQTDVCLEVVIVNDESKDHSLEVIHEYEKKYGDRITINVINQSNQGQGGARNTGIEQAKGDYLMFVDQDDRIEAGIVGKMLQKAVETDADIVSCGYCRVSETGRVKAKVSLLDTEWSKYKSITPWAKLYRADFIRKHQIRFLPVVLGEDIYFLMQAYSYEPKVSILSEIGYQWLDNALSVSNTAHKKLDEDTSLLRLYDMLEKLERKEQLKKDPLYEYFLLKTAVWNILYTRKNNTKENVKLNEKRIWEWFELHFPNYRANPYIGIRTPKGESLLIRMIVWGYFSFLKR